MKLPLAIVGASTRAAAASAARAGFTPLAADLFADADLRAIATATRIAPYPVGLLDWLRTLAPPAWFYTGALENYPQLVDQMAWIAPLWGNPGEVLERVRSPWELAHALGSAGLLFPEIRSTADNLPTPGEWLLKHMHSASGSGVKVWNAVECARSKASPTSTRSESTFPQTGMPPNSAFFQRRIDGTPCSAVFVAAEGSANLLGVSRQLIGEPWLGTHGFHFAGAIGPWPLANSAHQALVKLGNLLASQFELLGLFGVDFILAGNDVWTIEVNPRYTASVEIVERFTGTNALALHAAAFGSPPPAAPPAIIPTNAFHGKAILYARREIVLAESFARRALEEATRTPWPTLADIPPAGTRIAAGRPVLSLFAAANAPEEVEQRLRSRAAKLEQELNTNH
ncbi:MAG: ATP-grasp domain-containing protein [Pirellulales bacterium]|nr:ATP-grasp domain-containing protein [Pirellulales bacterium]